MMNIATRLKQARKSRGYTQDSLANAIGVSRGVISNIEYEKAEPQALVIHAICETLKINENWLISGQGDMENNPELEKSTRLLSEIYNSAKQLSEEEQDYILDMIKTFQKHRQNISNKKENYNEPESDCMTVDEMRELYDSFPDTPEELKRLYPPVPFPRKDNVG